MKKENSSISLSLCLGRTGNEWLTRRLRCDRMLARLHLLIRRVLCLFKKESGPQGRLDFQKSIVSRRVSWRRLETNELKWMAWLIPRRRLIVGTGFWIKKRSPLRQKQYMRKTSFQSSLTTKKRTAVPSQKDYKISRTNKYPAWARRCVWASTILRCSRVLGCFWWVIIGRRISLRMTMGQNWPSTFRRLMRGLFSSGKVTWCMQRTS